VSQNRASTVKMMIDGSASSLQKICLNKQEQEDQEHTCPGVVMKM
jgi:hypothetical protein